MTNLIDISMCRLLYMLRYCSFMFVFFFSFFIFHAQTHMRTWFIKSCRRFLKFTQDLFFNNFLFSVYHSDVLFFVFLFFYIHSFVCKLYYYIIFPPVSFSFYTFSFQKCIFLNALFYFYLFNTFF